MAAGNIFEGALCTVLYLGQNWQEDGRPKCTNLTAEWNIVRAAEGFRVKSPLRIDNCENAVTTDGYFEGFDETNNTSGINVFDEAMGNIEIHDNIVAFSDDDDTENWQGDPQFINGDPVQQPLKM